MVAGLQAELGAWIWLALFALVVAFFHVSEFAINWWFHGTGNTTRRNWLCSRSYAAAMGFAVLEFCVEALLVPQMKGNVYVVAAGAVGIVIGEGCRKGGEITAAHNFTHEIAYRRVPEHKLVTHGIYNVMRHPGYFGFFLWSVSTQLLLCNPVSVVAFTVVTWRFFDDRIRHEEDLLVSFFGKQYEDYRTVTPTRIPYIL
jgi:protein-S-isoprenylcysteine O-methyltransferase